MRWTGLFLCSLCSLALGLPTAVRADAAERERIAAERQRLTERLAREERECQQRFAVTDCVEDVRRRRAEALEPLRARELAMDDAERQRRAAERRAAIEARQREQAARPAPASAPEGPPPRPAAPASAAAAVQPAALAASAAAAALAASAARPSTAAARAREARAAERARAAQRRREDADAALERVRKRVAEREATGKAAAPLPVPDATSLPAR